MKIALLGDTHFGARGDSVAFRDHFFKFYEDVFFPYLRDNKIDTVIQMGDLMDRRKFVNFRTLSLMREKFIQPFESGEFKLHVIVGNHDTYYRHTNKVNSLNELFEGMNNITVYQDIKTIGLGSKNFLMLPWINRENYEESMDALQTSNADVVIGHLEIDGFEMHRGVPGFGGLKPKLFNRFAHVYSGHFHCQSSSGNITYLGTPYELTWSDYNDPKGFHIFDTNKETLTFIKNPYKMYHKIFYNDEEEDYTDFNVKSYENSIVKLIVVSKTDHNMYEKLIEKFNKMDMTDFQITDSSLAYRESDIDEIEVEDTLSTLYKHIDALENDDLDHKKLKLHVQEIYAEAIEQAGSQ